MVSSLLKIGLLKYTYALLSSCENSTGDTKGRPVSRATLKESLADTFLPVCDVNVSTTILPCRSIRAQEAMKTLSLSANDCKIFSICRFVTPNPGSLAV